MMKNKRSQFVQYYEFYAKIKIKNQTTTSIEEDIFFCLYVRGKSQLIFRGNSVPKLCGSLGPICLTVTMWEYQSQKSAARKTIYSRCQKILEITKLKGLGQKKIT